MKKSEVSLKEAEEKNERILLPVGAANRNYLLGKDVEKKYSLISGGNNPYKKMLTYQILSNEMRNGEILHKMRTAMQMITRDFCTWIQRRCGECEKRISWDDTFKLLPIERLLCHECEKQQYPHPHFKYLYRELYEIALKHKQYVHENQGKLHEKREEVYKYYISFIDFVNEAAFTSETRAEERDNYRMKEDLLDIAYYKLDILSHHYLDHDGKRTVKSRYGRFEFSIKDLYWSTQCYLYSGAEKDIIHNRKKLEEITKENTDSNSTCRNYVKGLIELISGIMDENFKNLKEKYPNAEIRTISSDPDFKELYSKLDSLDI